MGCRRAGWELAGGSPPHSATGSPRWRSARPLGYGARVARDHEGGCERLNVHTVPWWRDDLSFGSDWHFTRCGRFPVTWLATPDGSDGAWFCPEHQAEVETDRAAITAQG
jgi:hypothetical protein